jgi:hypothetical protein
VPVKDMSSRRISRLPCTLSGLAAVVLKTASRDHAPPKEEGRCQWVQAREARALHIAYRCTRGEIALCLFLQLKEWSGVPCTFLRFVVGPCVPLWPLCAVALVDQLQTRTQCLRRTLANDQLNR